MYHIIVVKNKKHATVQETKDHHAPDFQETIFQNHWKTKGAIIYVKTQLGEIPTLKLEKQ